MKKLFDIFFARQTGNFAEELWTAEIRGQRFMSSSSTSRGRGRRRASFSSSETAVTIYSLRPFFSFLVGLMSYHFQRWPKQFLETYFTSLLHTIIHLRSFRLIGFSFPLACFIISSHFPYVLILSSLLFCNPEGK